MSKNARATVAPAVAAPAVAAPAAEAKPMRLVLLKKDASFRGARQAWWERLKGLEGKARTEVVQDLEANRPSVYGAKSKHMGKPEPVPGWLRFYERNQYIAFRAE